MGHGETVCQLVDELVNQELYRRDFEFLPPVMPEDNLDDDSGEEVFETDANTDHFKGRNEIINGIEINTHSVMSPISAKTTKGARRQGSLMNITG